MPDHYRAKHGKTPAGTVLLRILIIVLIAALLAGGAWGVYYFFIRPGSGAVMSTEPPTVAQEPTLQPPPTHAPTQAPTEAPTEYSFEKEAKNYLSTMSLDEKICQLFIVTPEELTGVPVATIAGDTTKAMIEEYPVGGIIYNTANIEDADQLKELISTTQSYSQTPLLICVDEEGGDVARVAEALDETKVKPMFEYKDAGENTAYANTGAISSYLKKYGFNTDFAPVADVWTNEDNTVIGDRAYSDDYETAATLVSAAVKGFRDNGIISSLKHFPGHGDTEEDSHEAVAVLDKKRDDIIKNELLPFRTGIEAGADMVMVGHIAVPELDDKTPATVSGIIVPDLLRKELDHSGVVISDSLSMSAITDNYSTREVVEGLFKADIDIFLMPSGLSGYIDAVKSALDDEDITQAQLDAKVMRILQLKYKKGVMKAESDAIPTEEPTSKIAAIPATGE